MSILASAAAATALGAAPLPIEGFWRVKSGGGVIELHRCGETLCGRIAESDDLRDKPDIQDVKNRHADLRGRRLKGLDIFHGFGGGPDVWTDGRIYNPGDGRTYRGSLRLVEPDKVRVTGCLMFPLCSSQSWTRAR